MELQQLKYVVAVHECGSFTQAAKNLYVSQPSLSQSIKKLEKQLGVALFCRTTRSLHLTEEGEEFYRQAKKIVDACAKLSEAMEHRRSITGRKITIIVPSRFRVIGLFQMITDYFQNDDKCSAVVEECAETHLRTQLSSIDWDLAFMRSSTFRLLPETGNYIKEHLLEDPLGIITGSGHQLAGLKSVEISKLVESGIKVFSGKRESSLYKRLMLLKDDAEMWDRLRWMHITSEGAETMAELVRSKQCIAIGGCSMAKYYGLEFVPFYPARYDNMFLVYSEEKSGRRVVQELIEYAKQYYTSWQMS